MEWQLDGSHTSASFSVRHMMIATVRGHFDQASGSADVEDGKIRSAKVDIAAASVATRDEGRDNHLKSADFFDVENHPHLHFETSQLEHVGGDKYRVAGNLTIRGVTQPITMDATITPVVKDPWGNDRLGISATATLNRHDFNLNWNVALEAGGVLVGEQVKIEVDAEFVHQPN
jgi:polyisoprenoid-binding protein YceI